MSLVCCLGCVTLMGGRNRVVRNLTFFPPSPPGYGRNPDTGEVCLCDEQMRPTVRLRDVLRKLPNARTRSLPITCVHHVIPVTKGNHEVHAFFFQHIESRGWTLVFSHGNSTDIGFSWSSHLKLAEKLRCNLLAYDYAGYGMSTGQLTEANTYLDVRAVVCYAVEKLGIRSDRIVLYGQSVGSGPSVDLATDSKFEHVLGGLVLHSPLASGLRFFKEFEGESPWYDLYRSLEKCRAVTLSIPVLVVHGKKDTEVPMQHGMLLFEAIRQNYLRAMEDKDSSVVEGSERGSGHPISPVEQLRPSRTASTFKALREQDSTAILDPTRGYFVFPDNGQIHHAWWVDGAGHNDIELVRRREYFSHIRAFMKLCRRQYRVFNGSTASQSVSQFTTFTDSQLRRDSTEMPRPVRRQQQQQSRPGIQEGSEGEEEEEEEEDDYRRRFESFAEQKSTAGFTHSVVGRAENVSLV